MDFNRVRNSYRDTIERSIGFAGQGLDFFTEAKADYLRGIIARRFAGKDGIELLDIGCGHGFIHGALVNSGCHVTGVDMAEEVLSLAREENPEVTYVAYDGNRLPFAHATFDMAIAICVVHHVPPQQWQDFLREMLRVVRPGGIGAVFEHNPLNPLTLYVVANNEIDEDAQLVRAGTLRKMMRSVGFENICSRSILFTPFARPFFRWMDEKLGWLPFGAQYYAVGTAPSSEG